MDNNWGYNLANLGLLARQQRMKEDELAQQQAARRQYMGLLGTPEIQQQTQPFAADLFPGEQPIGGLSTITQQGQEGTGMLGGKISPQQFYGTLMGMPGYEQIGAQGLGGLFDAQNKLAIESMKRSGPFSGEGIEAQTFNKLIDYNQKILGGMPTTPQEDQAYALAYGRAGRPIRYTDSSGTTYEVPPMDLSQFTPPKTAGAQAPKPLGERKYAQGELEAAGYANRMINQGQYVSQVEQSGSPPTIDLTNAITGAIPAVGNFAVSSEYQTYMQAANDWIRSKLRKESGAVIGKDEWIEEYRNYFPVAGDSSDVIAKKAKARRLAEENMVTISQGAFAKNYPDIYKSWKSPPTSKPKSKVINFSDLPR